MSKPSSNFLRGANSGDGARSLDEPTVLEALGTIGTGSALRLSEVLQATPGAVRDVLWRLLRDDYVERTGDDDYQLTEAGRRALRYTSSAR